MILHKTIEWDNKMIKDIKEGKYPDQKIVKETDLCVEVEERAWVSKTAKSLTDTQKNEIIEKVFNTVLDHMEDGDMFELIGNEIYDYVTSKNYVHREE